MATPPVSGALGEGSLPLGMCFYVAVGAMDAGGRMFFNFSCEI